MTARAAEFGPWSKIPQVKTWRPNAARDAQPKLLTNEPAWGAASNPDEVSDKSPGILLTHMHEAGRSSCK